MGILKVKPDTGLAGTPMKITGSGLAKRAKVTLTWSTANSTWDVDANPGTVNYLGRQSTKFAVVIAKTTTNSKGSFAVRMRAPADWGGLHDIYAVINHVQVAHGGFLTGRKFTISPHSGPIGTPITITYRGFAPTLYEGGAALLYDNHDVGELMSNWTRGTGKAVIRAAGPVGKHTLEIGDAVDFLYLNLQQAPDSWAVGGTATFTVTKDRGRPRPSIDWPVRVAPTVSERTTLRKGGVVAGSHTHVKLATSAGQVRSAVRLTATGLTPHAPVQLEWSTVVGSRVNCTSTCWAFVSAPLGKAKPSGHSLRMKFRVPDGLGGWHVVQLLQGGKTLAQVPFYVRRASSATASPRSCSERDSTLPFTSRVSAGLSWTTPWAWIMTTATLGTGVVLPQTATLSSIFTRPGDPERISSTSIQCCTRFRRRSPTRRTAYCLY